MSTPLRTVLFLLAASLLVSAPVARADEAGAPPTGPLPPLEPLPAPPGATPAAPAPSESPPAAVPRLPPGVPPAAECPPPARLRRAPTEADLVPNAIGQREIEARLMLSRWQVRTEVALARPSLRGQVVNQHPFPGERLSSGETVTIVLGVTTPPTSNHRGVPCVEEATAEGAASVLRTFGFTARIREVPSAPDRTGFVVSQLPRPGSLVPGGSEVELRVGQGGKVDLQRLAPVAPTPAEPLPPTGRLRVPPSLPPPPPPSEAAPPTPAPAVAPPPAPAPPPPPARTPERLPPLPPPPTAVPADGPFPPPVGLPSPAPRRPPTFPPPTLISPSRGQSFPRAFGATFQWTSVPGARAYEWELQVEARDGTWSRTGSRRVEAPQFRPPRMERGRFRWRVRALGRDDAAGAWSTFFPLYMY